MSEILSKPNLAAILRRQSRKNVLHIIEHLLEGGIKYIEVTTDTPEAPEIIEEVKKEFGTEICIGAGTVLNEETADRVIDKGAEFIVSPTVSISTIQMTKKHGVVSIPGAMTPTEILLAHENGADLVKLFPANNLGPEFIKNINAPLPHIPIMATGGINNKNMMEYFQAGASTVGIGSSLVKSNMELNEENLSELVIKAKTYMNELEKLEHITFNA